MKNLTIFVLLAFTACVSAPRYTPQTMFPNGAIHMEPKFMM